ncbi:uncharacterized protein ACNLHF_001505 isoform 2-T9 [Anomaloglossus baeobatrachus]
MASNCLYFVGTDFSNQMLVIRKERESYCFLNKTTPDGGTVPCERNVTATKVNKTHVLLKTTETNVLFTMEYGRGKTGETAEPITADCPDPLPVPGKVKKTDGNYRVYYGSYAAAGSAIIIILIFIILMLCQTCAKKRMELYRIKQACSGNCASSSKDSSTVDLEV